MSRRPRVLRIVGPESAEARSLLVQTFMLRGKILALLGEEGASPAVAVMACTDVIATAFVRSGQPLNEAAVDRIVAALKEAVIAHEAIK